MTVLGLVKFRASVNQLLKWLYVDRRVMSYTINAPLKKYEMTHDDKNNIPDYVYYQMPYTCNVPLKRYEIELWQEEQEVARSW